MHWLTESEVATTLPESIARENVCVPLLRIGTTLVFAAANPHEEYLREKLIFILNQSVRLIARDSDWINAKIDAAFSSESRPQSADLPSDSTFYWANCTWYDGSLLCIKASGFTTSSHSRSHWSGAIELAVDHPDRAFWDWVVESDAFTRILTEKDVLAIRRIWQRCVRRALGT